MEKQCICCFKSKHIMFFKKVKLKKGTKRDSICDKCKKDKFDFEELKENIEIIPGFREVRGTNNLNNSRYKQYNLTEEDYNLLYSLQEGKCKICGISQFKLKTKLAVDHCHKTGKVRGLLCTKCNLGLGYFNDNYLILEKATEYLKDSYN